MLKDLRGREIEPGAHIVWPGRQGSSLWMTGGDVVKIGERKVWHNLALPFVEVRITHVRDSYDKDRIGNTVTLTRVDNIVVVG